jgi:hypothetical protein
VATQKPALTKRSTLNAAQGETDKFAVKYDKNADGSANYNNVTLAGTSGTTITNVKAGAMQHQLMRSTVVNCTMLVTV